MNQRRRPLVPRQKFRQSLVEPANDQFDIGCDGGKTNAKAALANVGPPVLGQPLEAVEAKYLLRSLSGKAIYGPAGEDAEFEIKPSTSRWRIAASSNAPALANRAVSVRCWETKMAVSTAAASGATASRLAPLHGNRPIPNMRLISVSASRRSVSATVGAAERSRD